MLQEGRFLLFSLLFGLFCGGIYDFFRIGRMLLGVPVAEDGCSGCFKKKLPLLGEVWRRRQSKFKKGWAFLLVFLGDTFYFLLIGCGYLIFIYALHEGVFRFYSLLGLFGGFWLYRISLGRAVFRLSCYLVFACRVAFGYIFFFLSWPFVFVLFLLCRMGKKLCAIIRACLRHIYAIMTQTIYHKVVFSLRLRHLKRITKGVFQYDNSKKI